MNSTRDSTQKEMLIVFQANISSDEQSWQYYERSDANLKAIFLW